MKFLLLLLFPLFAYSQFCPALGPDQILPCGVGSTTLTADLSQCGPGGANPNQTTNYSVASIPYVNQTNTGNQLFMTDDSQQGPFNIGFTFCFFGQTYTQFWVGSNGWISFSPGQPITFTTQTIPTGNINVPKNCIMGPWQDWHPGIGGQIRYQTTGVAPCRKLTVSWTNMPMFSCTNNLGTFHIVIYESTNYIENYIQSKPACLQWQNGTATQGIHNQLGTIGIASPGRNSSVWVANNDAYRWTPTGPAVLPTLTWYQVGNPNPIGTGPTINVTPPAAGASYTCQFVYPTCNAGWNSCNAGQGGNLGPDTVFVLPGPPNLPQPIINFGNPTCDNYCDGLIIVVPNGGNGVQTISWNGNQQGFNPINLCEGNYSFTITDALGCTVTGNVSLVDPLPVLIGQITSTDTVCFGSTNELYSIPDLGAGFTYNWTTNGTITSGQGTSSITIDWSNTPSGFINNAVSVQATSPNGCLSQVEDFNLTIFRVLPTITQVGPLCVYDNCVTLTPTPPNGTFIGSGINGNDFCPDNANIGSNVIIYEYVQSGCLFDTTITIDVNGRPQLGLINPHNSYFQICEGDTTTKSYAITSNMVGIYTWDIEDSVLLGDLVSYTWDKDGIYTISVVQTVNNCVSLPQQTTVTIDECPQELIYIPNTFTPDGNEHNQTFLPVFTSGFDPYDYELLVFNRWGNLIFVSSDHKMGWDGTFNNAYAQDGTYSWVIRYGDVETDKKTEIRGFITILK
jgi:gliding motility-associated-like protein